MFRGSHSLPALSHCLRQHFPNYAKEGREIARDFVSGDNPQRAEVSDPGSTLLMDMHVDVYVCAWPGLCSALLCHSHFQSLWALPVVPALSLWTLKAQPSSVQCKEQCIHQILQIMQCMPRTFTWKISKCLINMHEPIPGVVPEIFCRLCWGMFPSVRICRGNSQ